MVTDYPVFIDPSGKEFTCILYGVDIISGSGFEYYGFEVSEQTDEDKLYFGYMETETAEMGYFGLSELEESGICIYDKPYQINQIKPPIGWTKKQSESIEGMLHEIIRDATPEYDKIIGEAKRYGKMVEKAVRKTGDKFWMN